MIRAKRNRTYRVPLILLVGSLLLAPVPPTRAADLDDGHQALAENFAQLAQLAVSSRAITPETLRQSIALLKAAHRLNPDEARFARLLAEAALQQGDVSAALDAYTAITRRIEPDDRVAQMRVIDLHLTQMQTADARIKYLTRLMEAEGLPAEVRSHTALRASAIRFEQGRSAEGTHLLDQALQFNPLSPEALRQKFELSGGAGTPDQRVAILLTMLRSNPAQPGVMSELAAELADVGLQDLSLQWYNAAFSLAQRVGRGVTSQDYAEYAAQLVINGTTGAANQIVDALLKGDPNDVDAAFLDLIIARRGGDAETLRDAREAAERALLGRAQMLHLQIEGIDPQEAEQAIEINVPADIRKLLERGDMQLIAAYASTLADLAWLRIYFNDQPAEGEQIIAQLRQLLPGDSITLARLEGWSFLVGGRNQEARVKLSAVADRDPLAQLGMVRLLDADPATQQRATEDARKLMDENPSRLLGAIIHDALREKKPRLAPGQQPPLSLEAQDVKAELDAFPREWLNFIDRPQDFYFMRVEPLKVSHAYGEPIIARVLLRNLGPHDITVGPEGAIRPDIWFDVQVRGIMQQPFFGVAFDRLAQRTLLKPLDQIVQDVRIDQGPLMALLQSNATAALPLYFSAFNNPLTLQVGIAPGPGGQRVQFARVVNRAGTPFNEQSINRALADMHDGTAAAKIRSLELVSWFVRGFAQQQDPKLQARAKELMGAMRKTSNDPDARVRAWANFLIGRMMDVDGRRRIVEEMLRDNAWEPRMMALLLTQTLEQGDWKLIAGPLAENDPEPLVREFATAVVDFSDSPAASQPVLDPKEPETDTPLAQP